MRLRRSWLLAWAGACAALALPAAARDLAALSPADAAPGPGTPAAQAAPDRALLLPLPFDASPQERLFWDFSLRAPGRAASAIAVELSCDDPAAIRALTFHLQSGGHWLSAQKILDAPGRQTLYLQPADFAAESGTPDWSAADTLRLSAWKGAARATSITLHAVRSHAHSIAILRGSDLTAPGETALAAHCAARAQRLFEAAGLPAVLLSDDIENLDLRPYRLVVLPYNPRLTAGQIKTLERCVKRRGRLAVFYHTDTRLAKPLGFALLPYAASPEDWNTVDFIETAARGLPASMPHITRHLLPVRANAKDAATLGRWLTPDGMPDHNLPAAAVSPRGLWFSHIPPLASPSAIQWLLASLAASDPRETPALDAYLADARQRDAQAAGILSSTTPPANEIRAVWALPIPDRLRERTLSALAGHGINTVYEHLASGPFAHYRAGGDLPLSDLGKRRSRHHLSRALAAARTNQIALHAWVVCWSLDGIPETHLAPLRAQGRLMQDAHGNSLPWLSPAHPDNRAALLDLYADLARRGVAGLHLDYIRYPARNGCFAPATRAAFEKSHGRPVDFWPADVLPGGPHAAAYDRFRRDNLTAFVADVRRTLRAINPDCIVSAAVYPTPESAADNAQDWPRWLADDLLDYAAPMLYARDPARFADLLARALAAAPNKILPGIGTGADEAQLDALATARQILATRENHAAGFALFQLDSDLLARILPPLALSP